MAQGLSGEELETLLEENPAAAQRFLDDIHPEDVADVVDELADDRAGELLMQLPSDFAAQVFGRLDEERQGALAESMGVESTAKLALQMDADDLADFISIVPPAMSAPLIEELTSADPEMAQDIEGLRQWPETSAGGLMTTDYISVNAVMTIRQATNAIRESAVDAETIESLYVVDEDERLHGVLTMRRILLAGSEDTVESVMLHTFKSVLPDLDQEEVARKLAKYDLLAMPVVDADGHLLGVITADDVLDVMVAEQSEDVHKMGAVEPLASGYLDTTMLVFFQKRLPWLLVLFFGGFLSTQAMHLFEDELAMVTTLAFYLPMLVSAGGNSGSQSSTLLIRGLALNQVAASDWHRVLWRELTLGLAMGICLAVFGVARALIVGEGADFAFLIGVTVIAIVTLGCVIGAMAPLVLHRLGIDPATSSTPLIASTVDVLGIMVYLSLASAVLTVFNSVGPG